MMHKGKSERNMNKIYCIDTEGDLVCVDLGQER